MRVNKIVLIPPAWRMTNESAFYILHVRLLIPCFFEKYSVFPCVLYFAPSISKSWFILPFWDFNRKKKKLFPCLPFILIFKFKHKNMRGGVLSCHCILKIMRTILIIHLLGRKILSSLKKLDSPKGTNFGDRPTEGVLVTSMFGTWGLDEKWRKNI